MAEAGSTSDSDGPSKQAKTGSISDSYGGPNMKTTARVEQEIFELERGPLTESKKRELERLYVIKEGITVIENTRTADKPYGNRGDIISNYNREHGWFSNVY
jgi:hypothetical protein